MSLQLIADIVETFRATGNRSGGRHLSPMLAVLQLQAHLREPSHRSAPQPAASSGGKVRLRLKPAARAATALAH